MGTLGMTHSVCPECRSIVPAKVVTQGDEVHFVKFCAEHGERRSFVRHGVKAYLDAHRYVKPAWQPREFAGDASRPCPEGCGLCTRHEQHLCMPIIEITSRCNLSCPVCIASAGKPHDMTLDEFRRVLDALIRAERQVDILNLSGGEPLVHPQVLAFLDEALSRPEVIRLSISTNGRELLRRPELLKELNTRNVCVSLQCDGFEDRAYEVLRGEPLAREKQRILDLLEAEGATTSLTLTLAGGVNEDQVRPMLDYHFSHAHVVSLMIQPVAFAGRGRTLLGRAKRLTIPDVIELLASSGHPAVRREDFVPLPCSHPLCFSLAYYLLLEGGRTLSLSRLIDAPTLLASVTNRTIFGLDEEEFERLRGFVYELWSGPAACVPDTEAVLRVLREILRELSDSCCLEIDRGSRGPKRGGCFDPRKVFQVAERRVKSVFIHAFQDADTFDLARVRRCCNAYPQADGSFLPACVYNVLRRQG